MELKLLKSKTTTEINQTYEFGDYLLYETRINGRLARQVFATKDPLKTHPYSYSPKNMGFRYFKESPEELVEKIDPNDPYNKEQLPKSSFIKYGEIEKVNPDNLLCIYIGMDGGIYRINSPFPFMSWKRRGYIGGFTNRYFDLDKVAAKLNKTSWVRNVNTIQIPYYNCEDDENMAVEFEYKLPDRLIKKILLAGKKISDETTAYISSASMDIFGLKSCRIKK